MSEINNAVKLVILKKKKAIYEQSYYSFSIDLKVAEDIGDKEMREEAVGRMVKIKGAMESLDKLIGPLEKNVKDSVSKSK